MEIDKTQNNPTWKIQPDQMKTSERTCKTSLTKIQEKEKAVIKVHLYKNLNVRASTVRNYVDHPYRLLKIGTAARLNLSPPPLTDKEEYERFDELDQEILDEAKRMEGKHNQELFLEWTKEAKQQFIQDLLINYDLDGNLRIDEILLGYEFEKLHLKLEFDSPRP